MTNQALRDEIKAITTSISRIQKSSTTPEGAKARVIQSKLTHLDHLFKAREAELLNVFPRSTAWWAEWNQFMVLREHRLHEVIRIAGGVTPGRM